ncbi:MAG: AAA family ATPase, partial [Aquihabitans sp.]
EELSAGPQARARRFVASGRDLLDAAPDPSNALDRRLAIEALLREIDAAVPADARSEDLTAVRDQLVAAIAP